MTSSFLETLYSDLEKNYHLGDNMFKYFDDMSPKDEEAKAAVFFERCFLTSLTGNFFVNYWVNDTKEKAVEYLKRRMAMTKNEELFLRYGLHNFYFTKDYKALRDTIVVGINVLRRRINVEDQKCSIHYTRWFEILYPFAKKTGLSNEMIDLLKVALQANSINLRYAILAMIYESDQQPNKNLKVDEPLPKPLKLGKYFDALELAKLGLGLSNSFKGGKTENLLKFAAFYAEKTGEKTIIAQINNAYGNYWLNNLKPDNPKNLAIAFINDDYLRKAMSCFKKAHNEINFKKASLLYEENKKKLKFIHLGFPSSQEQENRRVNVINKMTNISVSRGTSGIIDTLLGYGFNIFCQDAKVIEDDIKKRKGQYYYQEFTSAAIVDSFGNVKPTTHENMERFFMIDMVYHNYMYHVFSRVISEGLKQKTLTYDILAQNLLRLGFDMRTERIIGNEIVDSSFLECVDIGLKDFLIQNERMMQGMAADWRFCITFLSTQFEGLLRKIVRCMDGPSIKMKNMNNTENILLEGLLNKDCLHKVFDDNDLLLFKETFTQDGYNIRNNIAHGLYLPQEYTSSKALLVFVSILRLAKATLMLKNNQNI